MSIIEHEGVVVSRTVPQRQNKDWNGTGKDKDKHIQRINLQCRVGTEAAESTVIQVAAARVAS